MKRDRYLSAIAGPARTSCRKIPCSIDIRMDCGAAKTALKPVLIAITLVDVVTGRTFLTGVGRINFDNGDSELLLKRCQLCFYNAAAAVLKNSVEFFLLRLHSES